MSAEPRDIACIELVELVTDYLDGVLDPRERERIDAHLADCDGCTAYVDQIRVTIDAAGTLTADEVPAPMLDRLLAVFREDRSASGRE